MLSLPSPGKPLARLALLFTSLPMMIPALTGADPAPDLPQQDALPAPATGMNFVDIARPDAVPWWYENEHAIEIALPPPLKCRQCSAILANRDDPFDSLIWLMHGCEVQGCCEEHSSIS